MAFARYYFEQVNAAYRKPDAAIIPALSTSECKSCDSLQGTVQGYVSQGQKATSAPTAPLTNVKMRVALPAARVMVAFTLTQNAMQVVDGSGKVVETQQKKQREQIAVLVWREGRWFMNGLAAA